MNRLASNLVLLPQVRMLKAQERIVRLRELIRYESSRRMEVDLRDELRKAEMEYRIARDDLFDQI